MTPAKRSPATPASQGPARAAPAPEVPIVADPPVPDDLVIAPVPPAETEDAANLLGPDGEPITEEAPTADAGGKSAPPSERAPVDRVDPATTQSPRRSRALHPERIWPD